MAKRTRTFRNTHKNAMQILTELLEWRIHDSIEFELRKTWNMRITVNHTTNTIDIAHLQIDNTWKNILIWNMDARGNSSMEIDADVNGINQAMTKLIHAILFNVQHNGHQFILSNKAETK